MTTGARTPEELETLLEDAFVLRDTVAFQALFEDDAVVGETWRARGFVSEPRRIVQSGNIALLIGDADVFVAHRGSDRSWRCTIAVLGPGVEAPPA